MNNQRIAAVDFGYRIIREKMPWLDPMEPSISGADFDRAGLPMVVACTGCQMTMTLASPTCRVTRDTHTWCASCAPPMFPSDFVYGANGDRLSQFVSTANMHARQYRFIQATMPWSEYKANLTTRELDKSFAKYLRLAAWEVGYRDLSDAMDALRARMGNKFVYYSQIQSLIDEVF